MQNVAAADPGFGGPSYNQVMELYASSSVKKNDGEADDFVNSSGEDRPMLSVVVR